MAEKILYYLGAGASANALPLARTIHNSTLPPHKQVPGLAQELSRFDFDHVFKDVRNQEDRNFIEDLKVNFKTLSQKADEFGDVDTYAKYLHIMEPEGRDFIVLKQTVSQYFAMKQVLRNSRDSRYLPWLVSIMDRKRFPENVKILSWNYDFQVELAAAQIGSLEDINHEAQSFVYSPSMLSSFPNLDPTFSDFDDLSLIHLNGIAGFSKSKQIGSASIFQSQYSGSTEQKLSFIKNNDLSRHLHFVWEKNNYHNSILEYALKMAEDTSTLVIIGYSFPFFNRDVDKKVMNQLMNYGTLERIYFQDPFLTGEQLRAQFNLPSDLKIIHIKNVDNFHIPFEY
jgi:hypothetical protein